MEGCPVLPPVLQATVDLRDGIDWPRATRVSPEVSLSEATVPFCNGFVGRFTMTVPDVHASVYALLFRTRGMDVADVSATDELSFLGKMCPESILTTFDGHRRTLCTHSQPHEAGAECSCGYWYSPVGHARAAALNVMEQSGGPHHERNACPTWFPDFTPKNVPLCPDLDEEVFYIKTKPMFGIDARDMVGRSTCLKNCSLSEEQCSALGVSSPEVYAIAAASCSGMLPAFRDCIRGGLLFGVTIQGPGSGQPGTVIDTFYAFDIVGNAALQAMVRRQIVDDQLHFIRLARWVQEELRHQPVDEDQLDAALTITYRLSREVRRRRNGTSDHIGAESMGCGTCAVQ